MGLFDLLRPGREESQRTASALEAARDNAPDDSAIGRVVQMLMDAGLDGRGPLRPATSIADAALRRTSDHEEAVERIVRLHVAGGVVGGFVTGLGGFITMPVAVPVNVAEFYLQATRMVGAIATVRGYDVRDPHVRTAVLLTLVGSRAEEVLARAGMSPGGGAITRLALGNLPPAVLMVVNKAVAFRLMRGVFERVLSRFGRVVPFVGGVIGAVVDGWMMRRIAEQALVEFPAIDGTIDDPNDDPNDDTGGGHL
jgi:EcsC protein family